MKIFQGKFLCFQILDIKQAISLFHLISMVIVKLEHKILNMLNLKFIQILQMVVIIQIYQSILFLIFKMVLVAKRKFKDQKEELQQNV